MKRLDVVCKMRVEENEAFTSEWKGKKYYFCSQECKEAFEENPERYIEE